MLKRGAIGLLGIVLLIGGVGLGAGVWWLWQSFGAHGGAVQDLGSLPVDDGASAIVIDIAGIAVRVPYLSVEGRTELIASDPSGSVTLLAGTAARADAFLDGSPYVVAALGEGGWSTTRVPGAEPLPDPSSAPWASSVRGAPAVLPIEEDTTLTVVVVPDRGSRTPIDLSLRYTVPDIDRVSVAGAVLSAMIAAVGLTLLWAAAFGLRRTSPS